ncbi:MAG: hypothetical protein E7462_07170 [Ruminococcaceae bacterium]|nr:hypothetical protein [Oscillospiraceae bacterium]
MEWIEANPIPEECKTCAEGDCYNCDTAGRRWKLSRESELQTNRMLIVRAIERLQRKITVIDAELEKLHKR